MDDKIIGQNDASLGNVFFRETGDSPRKSGNFIGQQNVGSSQSSRTQSLEAHGSGINTPNTPNRYAASPSPMILSSPRFVRMETEDGSMEEYQLGSPVIRHSKSLALRRCSSMVYNSPQLQVYSPPTKKRRVARAKILCPVQRLQSEDKISEGSSSGQESIEMEDELDSVNIEQQVSPFNLDEQQNVGGPATSSMKEPEPVASAAVPLPFQKMLHRKESDLFERCATLNKKDLELLQGKEEEEKKEFKIHKRWSGGRKAFTGSSSSTDQENLPRWRRSVPVMESNTEEQRIKNAVETFCRQGSDVIADGTVPYALPCFQGKKQELMFITCDTLADVLGGQYSDVLDHYKIVDCRYPYEYKGGHIIGALNMFHADNINEIISWKTEEGDEKRIVLIFHCEFSSQRGPSMMRLLRSTDRKHNASCYPHLIYPEIYLLEGGYKAFFGKYPHLCEPKSYIPMVHPDYADQHKMLSRSISWHGKDVRMSRCANSLLL